MGSDEEVRLRNGSKGVMMYGDGLKKHVTTVLTDLLYSGNAIKENDSFTTLYYNENLKKESDGCCESSGDEIGVLNCYGNQKGIYICFLFSNLIFFETLCTLKFQI